MKIKYQRIAALTAFSWIIGIVSSYFLPAGTMIILQYSLEGSASLVTSSPYALLMYPALMTVLSLIFCLLKYIEPRKKNLVHSTVALNSTVTVAFIVLLSVQCITVGQSFSWLTVNPSWIMTMIGILLIIVGNYLPKTKPNFSIGIRTPWTLSDDDIWRKTHRIAGVLFILAGLAVTVISTLDMANKQAFVLTIVISAALLSVIYSLVLWLRKSAQ